MILENRLWAQIEVDKAGDSFQLRSKYDPQVIASIKELPGRRWDPQNKVWLVKDSPQFRRFVAAYLVSVSEEAQLVLNGETQLLGAITQNGPKLILDSVYDARLIEAVRTIEGRKWDKDIKQWKFPLSSVRAVKQLAQQFNLKWDVSEDVPDSDPITVPVVKVKGGQFMIYSTYDRDVLDAIKEMPGVEWDRYATAFKVPLDCVVEIDEFVTKFGGELDDEAIKVVQEAEAVLSLFRASSSADANMVIDGLGGELMPFQRAGVLYALTALGFGSHIAPLVGTSNE